MPQVFFLAADLDKVILIIMGFNAINLWNMDFDFWGFGAPFYLVAIASTFLHPVSPPFRSSSLRPICFSLDLIMIISFLLGGAFVYVLSLRSEQNELLGLVGCEQTIEWFNIPFSTTFSEGAAQTFLKHKFGGSAKR